MRILDRRQETLVTRERALLESLLECLSGFGAPPADVELVRQALADVEDLFLLVIAGEFDSGKSAFIDALVGADLSEENVTPTTDRITLLRHGPELAEREQREGVLEKRFPSDFLREISVADTPILNAIIRHREELSREFVSRSDLVLFVASAERPLTDTGRGYLELIRDWGKKLVLVVNKADLLRDEEVNTEKVRSFIEDGIRSMLGLTLPIFFVSSFLARKAKAATSGTEREALLEASGFAELESYVSGILAEEDRVRLKLEGPLGVVEILTIRYQFAIDERMGLLDGDLKTCENVEAQLDAFREDMKRDFGARTAEIENIVSRMHARGNAWFEQNIRLSNIAKLARSEKVRERFQHEVVNGTEALVDQRVGEMVDWMVERNLEQWRSMVDYFNGRRQAEYDERRVAEIGDDFDYDRDQLLRSVSENVMDLMQNYEREREKIALSLRSAAAQTAAAVLTLGPSVLAGLGLFVLPNRRREAQEEFRQKTDVLRKKLGEIVRHQFEAEFDRSVERMREAIAPYGHFVRAEQARMGEIRTILDELNVEVDALKGEIAAPGMQWGGSV